MAHKSAAVLILGVGAIMSSMDLAEIGINYGKGGFALFVLNAR